MDFISLKFLGVFCAIFIIYWLIPNKCKNIFLLVISYLLYMMWKPTFAIVLLLITVITYFGAQVIRKTDNDKKRKHSVVLLTIISLSPLILFKYSGFISENIARVFSSLNYSIKIPSLDWAVPVGISFFTFQAVGYLLDVYHNRCEVESNIVTYSLFVSFFPQITSGPISTADELMPQFHSERKFEYSQAVSGLRRILFGVFLKTVIADRAGIYVDMVFANISKFSGVNCFITSVIYSIQIYADFFGYSLIAVGIAKLLGFDLINNFNRSYFAESITVFWRRWHISLSRWLKNHVYIPLGGSRCSKLRSYLNIIITFLVSGIWHGANWTFIVWGGVHGICQVIEKALGLHQKTKNRAVKTIRIILTFIIINFAWVVFRSPDIHTAYTFLHQILTGYKGLSINTNGFDTLIYMVIGVALLFGFEFLKEFHPNVIKKAMNNQIIRFSVYLLLAILILSIGVLDGSGFIYVSF